MPKANGRTINNRTYGEYPKIKEIKNMLKNTEFGEKSFAEMCIKSANTNKKKTIQI